MNQKPKLHILEAIIIGIVIAILIVLMNGCSHATLVKDCAQVESQDYYKCKTLKPWE